MTRDDSATARAGKLRAALADIETLHDATFDPPVDPVRTHRPPASRPPLPVGPLSARQHATRRLAEMVTEIANRRGLDTRTSLDDGAPALAAWVSRHADWVCEQPDLGWRVEDLELIAGDVRRAAEPAGIRRAKVGACPHCAGTLIAWIDDQRALPGRIACDREGHTWDREQWRHLGRVLDDTPDLLDATALAGWLSRRFLTTIEPSRVWQWRRRQHIAAVEVAQDGRPMFDRHQVAEWFLTHRARVTA